MTPLRLIETVRVELRCTRGRAAQALENRAAQNLLKSVTMMKRMDVFRGRSACCISHFHPLLLRKKSKIRLRCKLCKHNENIRTPIRSYTQGKRKRRRWASSILPAFFGGFVGTYFTNVHVICLLCAKFDAILVYDIHFVCVLMFRS